MKKFKRFFVFIGITIVSALILAFVFISPITKYLIVKYSKPFLGRQITIDGLFLNFFTGSMTVTDLKVLEADDKSVFFSCHKINCNITVKKMLRGKYEINRLDFVSPTVFVYQNGNKFNFDDLINRFITGEKDTVSKNEKPTEYFLNNISISGGNITYIDVPIKDTTSVSAFNFKLPSLVWNNPNTFFTSDFSIGSGGEVEVETALNIDSLDYRVKLNITSLDMRKYYKALRSFMYSGPVSGFINTDLTFSGNANDYHTVAAKGIVSVDSLVLTDSSGVPFTSLEKFSLNIDTINVAQNLYRIRKIELQEPYLKVDLYDKGNSITALLIPSPADSTPVAPDEIDYSNMFTMLNSYVRMLAADYILNDYRVDSLNLTSGKVLFNDYTLNDRFTYDLDNIYLTSGKINSANDSISFLAGLRSNKEGVLDAYLACTPDFKSLHISYTASKMRVSDFNPYFNYFVATPFKSGDVQYISSIDINDGKLVSVNKIHVDKAYCGRKSGKGIYDLPVRLAVALLRDNKGNIDLDIPVEGNLKDPEYKFGKIVWQIIKNIIIKAATAPYKLLAGLFNGKEEDLKEISFQYLQTDLRKEQLRGLDLMADALKDKEELIADISFITDSISESEQIALFKAKTIYYKSLKNLTDSLSADQLTEVNSIQNKDSLFNQFLNNKLNLSTNQLIPVQQKAVTLVGLQNVQREFNAILEKRKTAIKSYLLSKDIAMDRFKISPSSGCISRSGVVSPVCEISYSAD